MNRYLFSISLLFAIIFVSCGSGNKTQSNNDAGTTASTYETVVLNSNIPSPRKEMKGMVGQTNITINYGSPSVKGRKVWDGLVPYGKVWRTGANEATTINLSADVMVEGKKLAAGKYGLFTLPNTNEWVIIFNSVHDQWGSSNYDQAKDVLRVNVAPKTSNESTEALEFILDGNNMVMKWEKLSVPFQIKNQE